MSRSRGSLAKSDGIVVYVIAHLTDPHLGPLTRPPVRELANKRLIGFLNWHRSRKRIHLATTLAMIVEDLKAQSPDHIAVTGDLVNIALPSEFAPARAFLEMLGSPQEVTLVPGNHDLYVRAGAENVARHWGDYMRCDAGFEFPFVRRRGPAALIGLSTAVPTRPFMATGTLGFEQLHRLADILDSLRGEAFRIVLLHHPPVSAPHRHRERLMDSEALRETLRKHGAELVLHGHDHVHSLVWLEGQKDQRIPAIGLPSASARALNRDNPAAYNLYQIEGEKGSWHCAMISRGFRRNGASIVELGRQALTA